MQTITDSQEKEWGIRLNESVWNPVKDWPEWANRSQRDSWTQMGVILWSKETRTITRLKGRHALAILAQLRDNPEPLQQGCVVGEPAWEISLNNPGDKGKPALANEMVLSPKQIVTLFDWLEQEEEVLKQMAKEEEAERKRRLAQAFDVLFQSGDR